MICITNDYCDDDDTAKPPLLPALGRQPCGAPCGPCFCLSPRPLLARAPGLCPAARRGGRLSPCPGVAAAIPVLQSPNWGQPGALGRPQTLQSQTLCLSAPRLPIAGPWLRYFIPEETVRLQRPMEFVDKYRRCIPQGGDSDRRRFHVLLGFKLTAVPQASLSVPP